MKISEFYPKRYANGVDLRGRAVTVTVKSVEIEEMHPQPGAPAVKRPVVYFQETPRGIIMGAALARSIAAILGDDTDTWTGRRITLYPQPITVAGQPRTAIRARQATNGPSELPATLTAEDEEDL